MRGGGARPSGGDGAAGQRLGPRQQLADVRAGGEEGAREQRHLERVARLLGDLHVGHGLLADVEEADELGRIGGRRLGAHLGQLRVGEVEGGVGHQPRHHGVAQVAHDLLGHPLHLQPAGVERLELGDDPGAVALHQRAGDPGHRRHVHRPERLRHLRVAGGLAGRGPDLVEERERVAHPALRLPGHERQRRRGELHALLGGHRRQPVGDLLLREPAEVEALAAREDGLGDACATSVVAKMNFTCSGGSSSVLSSALKAPCESMWTSSTM